MIFHSHSPHFCKTITHEEKINSDICEILNIICDNMCVVLNVAGVVRQLVLPFPPLYRECLIISKKNWFV